MRRAFAPLWAAHVDVELVPDDRLLRASRALIARAKYRVLASYFIIDVDARRDAGLLVDGILHQLSAAVWRGVDARVLIGGSRDNLNIMEACAASFMRLGQLRVPCQLLTARVGRGSHMKFTVADDRVLTGSHNWSAGALTNQTQDSVLVRSAELAAYLTGTFEMQWSRASTPRRRDGV